MSETYKLRLINHRCDNVSWAANAFVKRTAMKLLWAAISDTASNWGNGNFGIGHGDNATAGNGG